jgi:hypothetical protein
VKGEKNILVKCPHCGEEIREGKACEKRGKESVPSNGMEVQYKEFKVSEMLDIKMPVRATSGKPAHKSETLQEKEAGVKKASSPSEKHSGDKRLVIVIAVVIIIIFVIASLFLLKSPSTK